MVEKIVTRYVRPKFILIFFCLLLFLHVVFTFCGFYGNDDAIYARDAADLINTGHFAVNDHYSLRWITIIFTAFFYKLFGVNAVSSAMFSFICFVIGSIIIYKLIRHEELIIQLLVFTLFFLNYTVIFYAHRLLPDAGVCLFVLLAYYAYFRQRFISSSSQVRNSIFFSVFIFLAVLTKETIFITFPLWISLLCSDIIRRKNYSFWISSVIAFSILFFAYSLYFKITKGDWLYRYHILQQANASYGDGTGASSFSGTMQRIGYMLWQSFLLNGDMEYLIPAIIGIIYFRSVFRDEKIKHIAISFFILLLSADLMTFSPTMYAPLLPDPR